MDDALFDFVDFVISKLFWWNESRLMNVASLDPYQTLEMMTFLDFPFYAYLWLNRDWNERNNKSQTLIGTAF